MREIQGSSVLILGYGREGQSTHRYIATKYPDIKVGIADQKEEIVPVTGSSVSLHLGANYLSAVSDYETIIRSPGISIQTLELQKALETGKQITTETNLFLAKAPGIVIGVTGTKGKSTTASLIAHILSTSYQDVRLVGNIGEPALDHLSGASNDTIFVAELSSHQLEDVRYSPHIAVILNIVPEHLDYYGDFERYMQTKGNIVKFQKNDDVVIFNPSHEIIANICANILSKKMTFSTEEGVGLTCFVKDGQILIQEGDSIYPLVSINELSVKGRGNLENVLAATTTASVLKIPIDKIQSAIEDFAPLPHRLEPAGEYKGIRFYNDSLATIPEAVINALEALGGDVETLIAGGFDRGLDFTILGQYLSERQLKTIILFPETGQKLWTALCQFTPEGKRPQKYEVKTMKAAVQIAFQATTPSKICLLSPGAPSFGIFKDYADRGDTYKELIKEMGRES